MAMARTITLTSLLAFALILPPLTAAQDAPQAKPPRPPENAKVLTGLDGRQIRAEMNLVAAALGVKCEHCHVQGNFPSDEKSEKRAARRMLELTKLINSQYFPKHEVKEGESILGRVTCFTCHQGKTTVALKPAPGA